MTDRPRHALILCTGNSARSILGEAILNRMGAGRIVAQSAGSQPKDAPHPLALELLAAKGFDTGFARSKSWDEFAAPGAPAIDFIFTVCDSAAAETCPVWPGHPMQAHWGIPDPAAATGTPEMQRQAFADAHDRLTARIGAFLALPLDTLEPAALKAKLAEIGKMDT